MFENFEKNFYFALNNHFYKDCSNLYIELLETEPNNSIILYLIAHSFYKKGDFASANFYLNKAKNLNTNIDFDNNFSNVSDIIALAYKTICSQENPYKAESEEKALNMDSVYDFTYTNVSNKYLNDNDLSNTISICKKGLELYPDNLDLKYNMSAAFLKSRELQYAWEGYESRINIFKHHFLKYKNIPKFNFQNKSGKLCVYASSCYEDTILFARFLPVLKMHGVNFISLPQKPLVSLFHSSRLDAQMENVLESEIDFQLPFMSLASLFNTNILTIYNSNKYIFADKTLVNSYKYNFFNNEKNSIGIVWRSNSSSEKSIKLEKFIPIIQKLNYFKIYSLQDKITSEEKDLLDYYNIIDLGQYVKDFSSTAAFIDNIDYIIGCDNAVTNLSCAMAKKTYVLLPFVADWRWGMYEEKTAWYSSAVLLRQKYKGDWDEVIKRLMSRLVYFTKATSI